MAAGDTAGVRDTGTASGASQHCVSVSASHGAASAAVVEVQQRWDRGVAAPAAAAKATAQRPRSTRLAALNVRRPMRVE